MLRELSDVRESTFSWRRKPKYAGVRMFVPLPAPSKANAAAVVVLFNRYLPSSSSSSSSFTSTLYLSAVRRCLPLDIRWSSLG